FESEEGGQDMQSDLLITDGGVYTSVVTGIPCASARRPRKEAFTSERSSAYGRERANVVRHYRRLRRANSQMRALQNEFQEDLAIAARLQRYLEPKPTVWGRVRVDTFSQQARTIGGDFGLVCSLDNQHLNLLVGDVSGHGIGAAVAASSICTETNAYLQSGAPLEDVLSGLNRSVLGKFNNPSFFFSVAAAGLDRSGRPMMFARAGHPPFM